MPTLSTVLLILNLLLGTGILSVLVLIWRRLSASSSQFTADAIDRLRNRVESLDQGLSQKLSSATADMASRLEQTKGDLRQQITDRLASGFAEVRTSVNQQLSAGREEQTTRLGQATSQLEAKFESLRSVTEAKLEGFSDKQTESLNRAATSLEQKFDQLTLRQSQSLTESRTELTNSLAQSTTALKTEFDGLNSRTALSLEAIRIQVDQKLIEITGQVQQKLDQNIKEGFAQFEKVQEHLKAAEEQLRNVGALGSSINDLNTLLKLPHLRGKFGEASLERLLADFLPLHMYDLQSAPTDDSRGRADAMINFPDRRLPIDSKFPYEQVRALFESADQAEIDAAREQFARVIKEQAKRIATYIEPESGTTDIAIMYLPSETLYLETIRDRELADWLNAQHVFPVSPNTLLMTLQSIALVYKWYQVAKGFEKTTEELGKAQKKFADFQKQFEAVGKSLQKAQDSYGTASRHLSNYRSRVTKLTGEEVPELEVSSEREMLPLLEANES